MPTSEIQKSNVVSIDTGQFFKVPITGDQTNHIKGSALKTTLFILLNGY